LEKLKLKISNINNYHKLLIIKLIGVVFDYNIIIKNSFSFDKNNLKTI